MDALEQLFYQLRTQEENEVVFLKGYHYGETFPRKRKELSLDQLGKWLVQFDTRYMSCH